MTKEELAQQYAEEKAKEFSEAIKEAYLKGYEQGELKVTSSIKINGVKYVDLGLPSGTLWSSIPLSNNVSYNMYPFLESNKFNIPTMEQAEELIRYTRTMLEGTTVNVIGVSGQRLYAYLKDYHTMDSAGYRHPHHVRGEGMVNINSGGNRFWVKSEVEDGNAMVLHINDCGYMTISRHFAGFELPLFLVKTREEIEQQ